MEGQTEYTVATETSVTAAALNENMTDEGVPTANPGDRGDESIFKGVVGTEVE